MHHVRPPCTPSILCPTYPPCPPCRPCPPCPTYPPCPLCCPPSTLCPTYPPCSPCRPICPLCCSQADMPCTLSFNFRRNFDKFLPPTPGLKKSCEISLFSSFFPTERPIKKLPFNFQCQWGGNPEGKWRRWGRDELGSLKCLFPVENIQMFALSFKLKFSSTKLRVQ